jgi:uncharacterized membrane protein
MAADSVRAQKKDVLAQALGWFSLVLGTAQLTAPGVLCRLVGARDSATGRLVVRTMGLRELAQGLGILIRPRPTAWLWSRVGSDGIDLSLLGIAGAKSGNGRARTAVAMANVVAVTAADVVESVRLTRKRGEPTARKLVRKSVTVNRPRDQVEPAWAAADELREKIIAAGASVRFQPAPGNRGTELVVEFAEPQHAAVAKLTGKDLATELSDDLHRLKQRIETGEIIRSDSTPSGHLLIEHVKQRPAQPVEEVPR